MEYPYDTDSRGILALIVHTMNARIGALCRPSDSRELQATVSAIMRTRWTFVTVNTYAGSEHGSFKAASGVATHMLATLHVVHTMPALALLEAADAASPRPGGGAMRRLLEDADAASPKPGGGGMRRLLEDAEAASPKPGGGGMRRLREYVRSLRAWMAFLQVFHEQGRIHAANMQDAPRQVMLAACSATDGPITDAVDDIMCAAGHRFALEFQSRPGFTLLDMQQLVAAVPDDDDDDDLERMKSRWDVFMDLCHMNREGAMRAVARMARSPVAAEQRSGELLIGLFPWGQRFLAPEMIAVMMGHGDDRQPVERRSPFHMLSTEVIRSHILDMDARR